MPLRQNVAFKPKTLSKFSLAAQGAYQRRMMLCGVVHGAVMMANCHLVKENICHHEKNTIGGRIQRVAGVR